MVFFLGGGGGGEMRGKESLGSIFPYLAFGGLPLHE